jgi:hypothetical protein
MKNIHSRHFAASIEQAGSGSKRAGPAGTAIVFPTT